MQILGASGGGGGGGVNFSVKHESDSTWKSLVAAGNVRAFHQYRLPDIKCFLSVRVLKGFDVWYLPIQNFVQGTQRPATTIRSKMQ